MIDKNGEEIKYVNSGYDGTTIQGGYNVKRIWGKHIMQMALFVCSEDADEYAEFRNKKLEGIRA